MTDKPKTNPEETGSEQVTEEVAPKEQVVNNEVVAQPKADQITEKAEVKELTPETNNDSKAAPAVKNKKEPFDKKKWALVVVMGAIVIAGLVWFFTRATPKKVVVGNVFEITSTDKNSSYKNYLVFGKQEKKQAILARIYRKKNNETKHVVASNGWYIAKDEAELKELATDQDFFNKVYQMGPDEWEYWAVAQYTYEIEKDKIKLNYNLVHVHKKSKKKYPAAVININDLKHTKIDGRLLTYGESKYQSMLGQTNSEIQLEKVN